MDESISETNIPWFSHLSVVPETGDQDFSFNMWHCWVNISYSNYNNNIAMKKY